MSRCEILRRHACSMFHAMWEPTETIPMACPQQSPVAQIYRLAGCVQSQGYTCHCCHVPETTQSHVVSNSGIKDNHLGNTFKIIKWTRRGISYYRNSGPNQGSIRESFKVTRKCGDRERMSFERRLCNYGDLLESLHEVSKV